MDPVSRAQTQTQNNQTRLARFGDKLSQFPKGVSGNPGGRPRTTPITKAMAKIARSKAGRELIAATITDVLSKSGMAAVLLLREMAERLEGPVTQNIHVTGEIAEVVRGVRERKEQYLELRNAS